ncbi:ECF transporter S component [Anaerosalibacter massiliensis]|uniref:ECF transporter S component n=1 Tax=Anaerosalibacter massiliensis TaxID=1347392 RepID=A0A9X2S4N6_9FIRM|nr:ECF transporter S component [Anaerosalibacter massiliensis]MCR2043678.1 ECF transporter S component [Anaerosalibacter massiliensis]
MLKKLVNRFSVFELIIIALMATLGIATKPVIVPLVHIITGPLYIPGGAIAGGLYMMWIVLGAGLIGKVGVATLIALVQSIIVISLGIYGTHGIMSFITYIIPGIAVDMFLLISGGWDISLGCLFISGILANLSGTFLVNLVFFRLPLVPLILTLSAATLSGGIGGVISYIILKKLKKDGILEKMMLGRDQSE